MIIIEWIALAWLIKWVIDRIPDQSYTKKDMEKFWVTKFDETSIVDPRKVSQFDESFLRRFKRRLVSKYFRRGISNEILVIDGVTLQDFDYIDLGRIRLPSQTVPVTIKSLVFSEDPRAPHAHPHLHEDHHHHAHVHDHPHAHDHDHQHAHGHSHSHNGIGIKNK